MGGMRELLTQSLKSKAAQNASLLRGAIRGTEHRSFVLYSLYAWRAGSVNISFLRFS